MIYIITLLGILICVVVFDFGRLENPQLKNTCFSMILIWLICLSGFAYNVGSDIPGYMRQYAEIGRHQFKTWAELSYYENRQPGWMLLNIACSKLSSHFVLLKFIIALFSNWVIFEFIKKHTKYVFLAVFMYYACFYLNWNFNSLRQTVSVALFLAGYDYMLKKEWIKYYLFCLFSFMFHSTAVICFIFPVFYFIKINSRWTYIFVSAVILFSLFAMRILGADSIKSLILDNADLFGLLVGGSEQLAEVYFGDKSKEYGDLNFFGIIAMLLYASPIIMVCLSSIRQVISIPRITIVMLLLYMLFYLMDFVIPVVFMRFLMYFDIIYLCAFSDLTIEFSKRIRLGNIVTVCLLCLALYRPVQTLFAVNMSSDIPLYRQFYPYYSVFDPSIDPLRAAVFGAYRDN